MFRRRNELVMLRTRRNGCSARSVTTMGPELSENLNSKLEKFKSHSHSVNNDLKELNREINRSVESNEANFKIKKNQMMTTNRKFHNLMVEFNNEQVKYRDKSQQRIRSYLQISGVEMDDDAIEKAIENGRIYDTVSILLAERDKKAIFEDVKSRHEDILKLEASIRELHEIFQDMSMLVESQGEILNNIEANVNAATDYANRAFRNVVQAKKARNRNIKLKIFAAICTIILIIILFFVGTAVFCFYLPFVCR
uniref:t-SNARE coiled-coil homology domain-containing protein n=1 Tax=Acrobeloides nanus TaxID=290746 RepID=A0A914DSG1_9BILA